MPTLELGFIYKVFQFEDVVFTSIPSKPFDLNSLIFV